MSEPNLMWQGKLNQIEKFGKLNQWIISLIHYVLLSARKVIMRKCPCINILSLGTSSYLNVETEPRMNHLRFASNIYAWLIFMCGHLCMQPIQSIFTKWWPFFNIPNGWHWYSISTDTQKTRNQTLGRLVIWNFSIWSIFTKCSHFFIFS